MLRRFAHASCVLSLSGMTAANSSLNIISVRGFRLPLQTTSASRYSSVEILSLRYSKDNTLKYVAYDQNCDVGRSAKYLGSIKNTIIEVLNCFAVSLNDFK